MKYCKHSQVLLAVANQANQGIKRDKIQRFLKEIFQGKKHLATLKVYKTRGLIPELLETIKLSNLQFLFKGVFHLSKLWAKQIVTMRRCLRQLLIKTACSNIHLLTYTEAELLRDKAEELTFLGTKNWWLKKAMLQKTLCPMGLT